MTRSLAIVAGVVSLALFSPFLREVYGGVGEVAAANKVWVFVAATCVAAGFVSSWALQRLALRAERWSDVAVPQLAGNAASNVLPAGSALGSAVQLRLLGRNGIDLTRAVTALTIVGLVSWLAGFVVMPLVLVLPIGSDHFADTATISRFAVAALLVCAPVAFVLLRSNRCMRVVASVCERTLRRVPRVHPPHDLAARIVAERDAVRTALREHKGSVVVTCIGRTCGDYLALYAAMLAVGLRPSPALVLFAFIAANTAGMVPITPGGLGFVEAGISGTIVLGGAPEHAALAAVAIYRLVSCWLPVAVGVAAYAWSTRAPALRAAAPVEVAEVAEVAMATAS